MNLDIIVINPIAVTGSLGLLSEHRKAFEERFAGFYIKRMERTAAHAEHLFIEKMPPVVYITEMTGAGIYAALWRLGEELDTGLRVNLRDIPVLQETVEICELANESPYEIDSAGCYLAAVGNGTEFLQDFAKEVGEQMPIVRVIGRTTKAKARIVADGAQERFLNPPYRQEQERLDRHSIRKGRAEA